MKKTTHPFAILAPYFALGAFVLTAAQTWRRHAEPILIVLWGVVAFYATFYFVRYCASFLGPAEAAAQPRGEETDPAPERE